MDARLTVGACLLVGCGSSEPPMDLACSGVPITVEVKTNAGNAFIPASDVVVSFGGCSGLTDLRGDATVLVPPGATVAPRFTRTGLAPTVWPELTVSAAQRLTVRVLRDTLADRYGLGGAAPLLWVQVFPGTKCASVDDTVVEIEGHPEAKLEYVGIDGPVEPTRTTTSLAGTALVRGLAAGTRVRVSAKKSGCTASSGPWGAVPLEAGVLSAMPIYLE